MSTYTRINTEVNTNNHTEERDKKMLYLRGSCLLSLLTGKLDQTLCVAVRAVHIAVPLAWLCTLSAHHLIVRVVLRIPQ